MDKAQEKRRFSLESRRYIGCKTKLVDWIFNLINEQTHDVHSFCDIFAGTGVVAHRALQVRLKRLKSVQAKQAPICWQYLALPGPLPGFPSAGASIAAARR